MRRIKFGKKMALALATASCVLFFGASAHFIYLATTTQPECVAHKKTGATTETGFSAAKSSC
ncbi:MAG: hypothetical protein ACAH83_01925 [Alphaproteobacteria bacterium]